MVDIVEGSEFSRLRRQAALADEDLARRLGVSVRTLARYETGESRPRPPVLEILKNLVNSPPCPSPAPHTVGTKDSPRSHSLHAPLSRHTASPLAIAPEKFPLAKQ